MTSIASQASANLTGTNTAVQLGLLQPGDVVSAVVAKVLNAATLQLLTSIGSFDVQPQVSLSSLGLGGAATGDGGQLANGSSGKGASAGGASGNGVPVNVQPGNGAASNGAPSAVVAGSAQRSGAAQANGPLAVGARVELVVSGTQAEPTFTLRSPVADAGAAKFAVAATLVSARSGIAAGVNTGPVSPAILPAASEPLVQAAAALLRTAVARQGGLAQLYADLGAALTQPNLTVPRPVAVAISQLLAARLQVGGDGGVDADAIRTAVALAGLNQTALSATGQPLTKAADMGLLLSQLRQALKSWADSEPEAPAMTKALPTAMSALSALTSANGNKPSGPMPPYRDGPTVAQALAAPSLPDGATSREVALHLLDKTDAAAARQTLLQVASLPDHVDPAMQRTGTDATRMMFDVPLATPQGTTVAQIRIERDGRNGGEAGTVPVWRASFSVDIEPVGPVHVRIALINGKATVALNAERVDSAVSLHAALPSLEAGLRNADIEPGTLSCRASVPAVQPGPPGMFVDRPS
ncbi:MAG: hypothetical protein GC182_21340 [Rhodopseudomonas sp.]|nr:hypothetical protein [Rhodopseudomonas sp.]